LWQKNWLKKIKPMHGHSATGWRKEAIKWRGTNIYACSYAFDKSAEGRQEDKKRTFGRHSRTEAFPRNSSLEKITVGYTLTPAQHGFIRQLSSFTTSRQASDAMNNVMVGPPDPPQSVTRLADELGCVAPLAGQVTMSLSLPVSLTSSHAELLFLVRWAETELNLRLMEAIMNAAVS
jgi:hypothetical protein